MANYRTWSFGPVNFTTLLPESAERSAETQKPTTIQHVIPVRLGETDTGWTIEADVPGIDPANISMEFFQNKLTISYQRPAPESKSPYDNRTYGDFQRVIKVAEEVQADAISAKVEHGTLSIFLPKSATNQPRRIVVNGNG